MTRYADDPARAIAAMLAKLDEDDKDTLNGLLQMLLNRSHALAVDAAVFAQARVVCADCGRRLGGSP